MKPSSTATRDAPSVAPRVAVALWYRSQSLTPLPPETMNSASAMAMVAGSTATEPRSSIRDRLRATLVDNSTGNAS
ncbi:hypothetical protein D3C80_2180190 [compost metagenome]